MKNSAVLGVGKQRSGWQSRQEAGYRRQLLIAHFLAGCVNASFHDGIKPHQIIWREQRVVQRLCRSGNHFERKAMLAAEASVRVRLDAVCSSIGLPLFSQAKRKRMENVICFNCNQKGHFANNCPQPKAGAAPASKAG